MSMADSPVIVLSNIRLLYFISKLEVFWHNACRL